MKYENSMVTSQRVKELLTKSGITFAELSRRLWGPKSHNSISYFDCRPDLKVSTLIKMAEIFGCSLDDLLIKSDSSSDTPNIQGNNNVVNSNYVNTDVTTLRAEIKALKMVIREKDQRIEDLKNTNKELGQRLDYVLQIGREKDHK